MGKVTERKTMGRVTERKTGKALQRKKSARILSSDVKNTDLSKKKAVTDAPDDGDELPQNGLSAGSDSELDFNPLEDDSEKAVAGLEMPQEPSSSKHTVIRKILPEAAAAPASLDTAPPKNIIYVGRLPHGFQEKELRQYFSQFGEILNLRLSRNKKTGRSKHYAFIEFKHALSAQAAAETMNNYLLFGHLLRCMVLAGHHPSIFKYANKRFVEVSLQQRSRMKHDRKKSRHEWDVLQKLHDHRKMQKLQKLKELGFEV